MGEDEFELERDDESSSEDSDEHNVSGGYGVPPSPSHRTMGADVHSTPNRPMVTVASLLPTGSEGVDAINHQESSTDDPVDLVPPGAVLT